MGQGDLRFAAGYFFMGAILAANSPFLQVLLYGLGYGKAQVGLFLGLFEAVGIGGPLIMARLADRRGAYRPLLLIASLLAAAGALPLAMVRSPWVTVPSIAVLALGVRSLIPVMDAASVAHVTKVHKPESGPRQGFGALRSAGTVGFIALLVLTQIVHLERASPLSIGLWLAGTALVFTLSLPGLPESGHGAASGALRPAREWRIDPLLVLGLLIIALGRLAMAPVSSFLTLYSIEYLHSDAASLLWGVAAISEIPALIFGGRLAERIGPMRVMALVTLAIILRLAIYVLIPTLAGAFFGQLLHFFCYGLFLPAAITFIGSRVPPGRRAWGMALFAGFGTGLPSFLGSAIGGLVLESGGYAALFTWFIAPAALALLIYAVTAKKFRKPPSLEIRLQRSGT
jgi:PPP family 3-phenylpropionic acid transporter